MWIRSQDKMFLIDAKNLVIVEDFEGDWYHVRESCEDSYFELGRYKQESTALEVLDMIQDRIEQSYLHKIHKSARCLVSAEDVVFEMPKDVLEADAL